VDDLSLKVDEIHCSILLEARSKKGKPRTGAFRIPRTQTDTSTFERVLLDYLGHQDLQFHAEEYGTLGVVRHSNSKTVGHRCCAGLMQVTPTFFVTDFGEQRGHHRQNIDPREGR
jgi:hypothetical protein